MAYGWIFSNSTRLPVVLGVPILVLEIRRLPGFRVGVGLGRSTLWSLAHVE